MSESKSKLPFYAVGLFWGIALIALIAAYFVYDFTQYRDTVPSESVAARAEGGVERTFALSSSAFAHGDRIPAIYTCDEKQMSPPLSIGSSPEGTKSFALIMEDRDIPKNLRSDGTFLHWVVYDIAPQTREIATGQVFGTDGVNGLGVEGYMGPCPPPQHEPTEHRYYFTLYALDTELGEGSGLDKAELIAAMEGHILAQTELMGRYERRTE